MKIKQRVSRTEETFVEVEFPVYVQHDVGDHNTYVVSYRYELQNPNVPTFLVSQITQNDDGFEFSQYQRMTIDADLANNRVVAATWDAAVEKFARWSAKCLEKMRSTQSRGC